MEQNNNNHEIRIKYLEDKFDTLLRRIDRIEDFLRRPSPSPFFPFPYRNEKEEQ